MAEDEQLLRDVAGLLAEQRNVDKRLSALEAHAEALRMWIMRMMWIMLISLITQVIGPFKLTALGGMLKGML
jgi:hypothetical protein